jgi:hypothetical protein
LSPIILILRLRSDELDIAGLALLGELRVFGEKTVARMDRIDIGDFRRADDAVGPQVAVAALRATDANRLVGQLHMKRLHIGFRINGERLDAEFATGANNAQGNFTAIGDEDLLNHRWRNKKPPNLG